MPPRIPPVTAPYDDVAAPLLEAMMPPGVEPIALFRTFVRNPAMSAAMGEWGRYELGRSLSLTMRDREIVIHRTTALCRCEYEWGVHVAFFAPRVGLDDDQLTSLTHGSPADPCWTDPAEAALIRAVDQLHDSADIDDAAWQELAAHRSDAQLLDVLLLAGWYHAISFAATVARVEPEEWAPRFADYPLTERMPASL
jgi:alkylhydroperoxidase family enzyme